MTFQFAATESMGLRGLAIAQRLCNGGQVRGVFSPDENVTITDFAEADELPMSDCDSCEAIFDELTNGTYSMTIQNIDNKLSVAIKLFEKNGATNENIASYCIINHNVSGISNLLDNCNTTMGMLVMDGNSELRLAMTRYVMFDLGPSLAVQVNPMVPDASLLSLPSPEYEYLTSQSYEGVNNWPEVNSFGSTTNLDDGLSVGDRVTGTLSYRFSPPLPSPSQEPIAFRIETLITTSEFVAGSENSGQSGSMIYLVLSPNRIKMCKFLIEKKNKQKSIFFSFYQPMPFLVENFPTTWVSLWSLSFSPRKRKCSPCMLIRTPTIIM